MDKGDCVTDSDVTAAPHGGSPIGLSADEEKIIKRHINALRDDARMADANAALFRPEFEACRKDDGSLSDVERALQLRDIIFDGPAQAKFQRSVADIIGRLLSLHREAIAEGPASPEHREKGESNGNEENT